MVTMPFWMESDTFHDDPRWHVLAAGWRVSIDQLQAAYARLMSVVAHHMSDGYLTEADALRLCGRRRVLDALVSTVLSGRPFLHKPGDQCDRRNCLDASGPWIAGYSYRICGYLKKNPAKAEHARHLAQKADGEDPRLRAEVYDRDGGCCRYCRSGPLKKTGMGRSKDRRRVIQYDHVDPDRDAQGGANYVVSCARCNQEKGHCTPDEADMALLPEPSPQEAADLRQRPETLLDRQPLDRQPDRHLDRQPDRILNSVSDSVSDPVAVDDREPNSMGPVRPDDADRAQRQSRVVSSEVSGSGRVGPPVGLPSRSPDAPDVYHHRSRPAGQPVYVWPPGSVPATPREDEL